MFLKQKDNTFLNIVYIFNAINSYYTKHINYKSFRDDVHSQDKQMIHQLSDPFKWHSTKQFVVQNNTTNANS